MQDGVASRFLLHDRDTKFTRGFDKIFETEGMQVIPLPFQAPRANAFAKRWVGTARREVLDHHLIFGRANSTTYSESSWTTTTQRGLTRGLDNALPFPSRPAAPVQSSDATASAASSMSTIGSLLELKEQS